MRVRWLLLALWILAGCELVVRPGDVSPPGGSGDAGGVCQHQTCTALGKACGFVDDGCGTQLFCGSCPAGQSCSAQNACVGCAGETDAQLCQKAGAVCGALSATDRCGAHRTADCGSCSQGLVCGATRANACGCTTTSCPAGSRCEPASGACVAGCSGPGDCPANAQCVGGSCVCPGTTHLCNSACVDNNELACGDACRVCPTDPNGSASCDGQQCYLTCSSGWLGCGGACVACPTNASATTCQAGTTCIATGCVAGYELCGSQCCNWQTETVGSSSKAVSTPALAVDPTGAAYVAFAVSGTTAEVRYAKRTSGGSWSSVETVDSLSTAPNTRQAVAIAADAAGNAYVAYLDGSWYLWLGERKKGSTTWKLSTISTGMARAPAIALDGNGGLHIAWSDTDGGDGILKHSYRAATDQSFTTETVDPQLGAGYWTALAIDAAGALQLAEVVSTGTMTDDVSLATKASGGTWSVSKVGEVSLPTEVKVALDAQGAPQLAWTDPDLRAVRHAWKPGAQWQMESVSEGDVKDSAAIAFLSGLPHLAYSDGQSAVQHAWQSGSSWQTEQVNVDGTMIALVGDGQGGLRMSFRDGTSGAVRYAYFGPSP